MMGVISKIQKLKKNLINDLYIKKYVTCNQDNDFVKSLNVWFNSKNVPQYVKLNILHICEHHEKVIQECLYNMLSAGDKELFLQFLLKRYGGFDTAKTDVEAKINAAFKEVENIYKNRRGDILSFSFRNKDIKFRVYDNDYFSDNPLEKRLMDYYLITHAFFLLEYEKDGFNPENGQAILDCGAASGDTSLVFRTLYPDSTIYAFEYQKELYDELKQNLELNHVKNIYASCAFLYSDTGKHYVNNEYQVMDIDTQYDKRNLYQVDTLAIDDFVQEKQINNIGLIKFDIEGGEQEALKGAIKTIKKYRPLLYIPIYHRPSDIYKIPEFLSSLDMKYHFELKWTEQLVWGMDCVLFVRFDE